MRKSLIVLLLSFSASIQAKRFQTNSFYFSAENQSCKRAIKSILKQNKCQFKKNIKITWSRNEGTEGSIQYYGCQAKVTYKCPSNKKFEALFY